MGMPVWVEFVPGHELAKALLVLPVASGATPSRSSLSHLLHRQDPW